MSRGTKRGFAKDEQIIVTVERILPFGVFVRLEDGKKGYIRRRELSLEGDVTPQEVVSPGQQIEAVILELEEPALSIELSHRATLPDPWEEFTGKFRQGDVIKARIKDLVPTGAFAQILPGVDGFIPTEELTPWTVENPEEVVWVGDDVEAVITRLESTRQGVGLSIRLRLKQLSQVEAIMEQLHQKPKTQITGKDQLEEQTSDLEEYPDGIEQAGPVLVVDDHDGIREPLVKWLSDQGCPAHGAKAAPEALDFCKKQNYGLILVDLDLPEIDGLSLMRRLRGCGDSTPMAVMSNPEWLEKHLSEIQALKVADVFSKPLDPDDIRKLLLRLARGEKPQLQLESVASSTATELRPYQELVTVMRSGQSLARRFQQGLEQLVEATRAKEGIIFHLDPISQTVSIVAQAGAIPLNQDAIYSLVDSPVKDVIREGGEVWENRVSQKHTARFRKLLDLLPFESCIGVPIEASGQVEYALFLFHRKSKAFSRYHLWGAWAMATLFAVALEQQALDERIQAMSRIFLSGQLAAGFGHEVSNKLSGLELQFRNTRSDFERLWQEHPELRESFDSIEVRQALDKAVEKALDLKQTVKDFQKLMKAKEEAQDIDVNQAVRQAEALVRPLARRAKVDIRLTLGHNLPPVIGSNIGLQQVFLNLMLNAVQHTEHKPDDRRALEIATIYETGDGDFPVKVRFSDTGPGIHRQLWEKIFALGFSSRPGGSGLGLYIARSLVGSMGGHIFVKESLIPLGTTFLVELPAG
ncbi:MAG: S1 RNA-binding domain-containing protein [Dehalococcoidia bacterium]|nr:S1 RNA-binding domain-containing protein [Dehalococcoidia bacterium]